MIIIVLGDVKEVALERVLVAGDSSVLNVVLAEEKKVIRLRNIKKIIIIAIWKISSENILN
jgi:hypothetical protein